jgi:hypothetical protein
VLLRGVEVNFIAGPRVRTVIVGCELLTQLFPGVQGPWGRFMSHNWVMPVRATGKYLAMTTSFPPAARMEVE